MSRFSKVRNIISADTNDIRELALICAADPETFFRGADFAGADLRGVDLRGFSLANSSLDGALLSRSTSVDKPYKSLSWRYPLRINLGDIELKEIIRAIAFASHTSMSRLVEAMIERVLSDEYLQDELPMMDKTVDISYRSLKRNIEGMLYEGRFAFERKFPMQYSLFSDKNGAVKETSPHVTVRLDDHSFSSLNAVQARTRTSRSRLVTEIVLLCVSRDGLLEDVVDWATDYRNPWV